MEVKLKLHKKQIVVIWIGLSLFLPIGAYFHTIVSNFKESNQNLLLKEAVVNLKEDTFKELKSVETSKEMLKAKYEFMNAVDKKRIVFNKLIVVSSCILAYISIFILVLYFSKKDKR
jgi:hypothetical protein